MTRVELEKEVAALLTEAKLTVAVAESCTGGLLGYMLTSQPGSSDFFLGGIMAYSNEVKTRMLGVGEEVLRREGAVSEAVAGLMAVGVRDRFGADLGVAITGVAGPGGGSAGKQVGLVYTALADGGGCRVCRHDFPGKSREAVRRASATAALRRIREFLGKQGENDG